MCLVSFFFYCYGHPRVLHSFPTRRSSDLSGPRVDPRLAAAGLRRALPAATSARRWGRAALDRKSTRLNSSHQITSYAVFCLKKKKEQDTLHHGQGHVLVGGERLLPHTMQ